MTRVLSALLLLPIVIGVVWFLPPIATLLLAALAAALAFVEYARARQGARTSTCQRADRARSRRSLRCVAVGDGSIPLDGVVLLTLLVDRRSLAVANGQPGPGRAARRRGDRCSRCVYIGLPLGALAAIRTIGGTRGRPAADGDDHRQRLGAVLHRPRVRPAPLAPSISPKKTRRRRDRRRGVRNARR